MSPVRTVLALGVGLAMLSAVGCGDGERVAHDTASPAPVGSAPSVLPTPGKALASKVVHWPGSRRARWSVFDLYRHGRFVTLDFAATNTASQPLDIAGLLSSDGSTRDVSGVSLRDEKHHKRYRPARFDGQCYCSYRVYPIVRGQTAYLTATFAAPPAGVDTLDVSVPRVGTFDDVPVGTRSRDRPTLTPPAGLPEPVASRVSQTAIGGVDELAANRAYLVTSVYGVYRHDSRVTVELGVTLQGVLPYELTVRVPGLFAAPEGSAEDPSAGASTGISLIDSRRGRAYRVARGPDGQCLCAVNPTVFAYATTMVRATFAGEAAKRERLDVVVPHAGVFAGVPVTEGEPPEPDAPSPLPHSFHDSVTVADNDGDGPVAKAPVVRVETRGS